MNGTVKIFRKISVSFLIKNVETGSLSEVMRHTDTGRIRSIRANCLSMRKLQKLSALYTICILTDGAVRRSQKHLNDIGIPNPTRYKQLHGESYVNASEKDDRGLWTRTTVKRIIKNEMYIGNMVQGVRKKVSYKSKKNSQQSKRKLDHNERHS